MVQSRMIHDLHHRVHRARLGVISAVNQAPDPRVDQSAGAHGARLNCSKQVALTQTVIPQQRARLPESDDLGVSRRIVSTQVLIPSSANHLPRVYYDGADRHLAGQQRLLGAAQGFFHEKFVAHRNQALPRLYARRAAKARRFVPGSIFHHQHRAAQPADLAGRASHGTKQAGREQKTFFHGALHETRQYIPGRSPRFAAGTLRLIRPACPISTGCLD